MRISEGNRFVILSFFGIGMLWCINEGGVVKKIEISDVRRITTLFFSYVE